MISIIVPIYKAEKYLHRCIDSILAQSYTDFELLLIDDGSPDNSGIIIDEYAAKDERVRVFHKENGGVSSARQFGIEHARGEYTIHADPDDWVEPNMLEELLRKAKDDNADMVICDYYVDINEQQFLVKQQPSALDSGTVLKELFLGLSCSCWNKLVRRDCYENLKVRFDPDFILAEDCYFNVQLLKNPIKVSYLPLAFYHYVQGLNENSLSISFNSGKYTMDVYLHDKMVYDKFTALLDGFDAYCEAEAYFGYNIVVRAFRGGLFSSKEFKTFCKKYKSCVRKKAESIWFMWILLISCSGGYFVMYKLYFWLKKCKESGNLLSRS